MKHHSKFGIKSIDILNEFSTNPKHGKNLTTESG